MEFEGQYYETILLMYTREEKELWDRSDLHHVYATVFHTRRDALERFAEKALQKLIQRREHYRRQKSSFAGEIAQLKSRNDELEEIIKDWVEHGESMESRALQAEAELAEVKDAGHKRVGRLRSRIKDLEKELAAKLEQPEKEKVDQVVQTVFDLRCCAVEVQASVSACERACQTACCEGERLKCCERAVQTTLSCTKLASFACWKCGKIGHFRKQCRSKGRRRCFACHEVGHIRRFCPSRLQRSVDHGEDAPVTEKVLAVSKVGGRRKMGGRPADAQAPTPPGLEDTEAEVRGCLDDIISLVMKRHHKRDLVEARRKKKRKEKKERDRIKKQYPLLGGQEK